jgi:hypothetical protein
MIYKTLQKTYRTNHVDVPQLIKSREKMDGEPMRTVNPKDEKIDGCGKNSKKENRAYGQIEASGNTIQARTKTTRSRSNMQPMI